MRIIIEGIDRVGKDTLINNLINYLPEKHEIFHCIAQKTFDDSLKYYYDFFAKLTNENIIANRSHLGEMVYAQKYRGYSGDYVLDIENKFSKILDKTHLILLYAGPKIVLSRDDGLSLSNKINDIKCEIDLFKIAFNKSNIKHKLSIDCSNKTIDDVFQIAKDFIGN